MNKFIKLASYLTLLSLQCLLNQALAEERAYTVGVVPQFTSLRTAEIWQPVIDQISRNSGIQLELRSAANIPEFEQQFINGTYDFAYMNPYHLIVANEKQGYKPLLRDTGRHLYGIIVVRKDSDIQSVQQLDEKTIAYPAPNALGAALIPRTEFHEKFNINTHDLYVKSHTSVYLNVLLGKAAAGGGVQKTLSQQPKNVRDQLRILYRTTEVSPHPFTVHPRISKDIQDTVVESFMKMGSNNQGVELLKNIPIKRIGKASLSDYNALKEMGLSKYYINN